MADGTWRPISRVKAGDYVIATDPKTGARYERRVERVIRHAETGGFVRVSVAGGDITATGHHPFWNATTGLWQRADTLGHRARLLSVDGGLHSVEVSSVTIPATVVYDLTVDSTHTFHVKVGASAVLVHNASCSRFPDNADDMDDALGFPGQRVPDGPGTPGRNKTVWRPNQDTKITFEQHPYHPNAPPWHRGPHWHLDTPGRPHQRYQPGDSFPGM